MQTPIEPGIFLPELELWLDSRRVKPEGYISHAHSDHLASHHHVLATAETIALAAQRMKIKQAQALRYRRAAGARQLHADALSGRPLLGIGASRH